MKTIILSILILSGLSAQAKIQDFNNLIQEAQAEQELMVKKMGTTSSDNIVTKSADTRKVVMIDENLESFSSGTTPELLVFEKERVKPTSNKAATEKVAAEIQEQNSF